VSKELTAHSLIALPLESLQNATYSGLSRVSQFLDLLVAADLS